MRTIHGVIRSISIALLLTTLLVTSASAQVEQRIESGDAEIVLTVWKSKSPAEQSVVLVPGWGGGPADVLGVAEFLSTHGVLVIVVTPRGWHASGGKSTFANALDDSVRRVFSIAGTDHGQFIRQYQSDPAFAEMVDQLLNSSAAPEGPIRFDVEFGMREMAEGQETNGLLENTSRLATRSVLLVGGWEDVNVTVDETLLPLYRALGAAGADEVTFQTYHADHSFSAVRSELHHDLFEWISR